MLREISFFSRNTYLYFNKYIVKLIYNSLEKYIKLDASSDIFANISTFLANNI